MTSPATPAQWFASRADLSIVIVNWNSASYAVKCIESLRSFTNGLNYEIVVVDNASTDDSPKILRERLPDVTLISSPENLGFARANNLAFQRCSGRNLLFLNPDTELLGPAINSMLACLDSNPDIGVLGCKLLNSDLSLQTSCIHRFPTILNQVLDIEGLRQLSPRHKLWGMRPLFEPDRENPVSVDAVSGACQMIRRDVFEEVGLFSPDYFMYTEDLDLCYKVRRIGKHVYYLGTAAIVHHGGQSSSKRGGEHFFAPMMKESLQMFLRKSRGPVYACLYRFSMFLASVVRLTILAVLFPIPSTRLDKATLRHSLNKWYRILRWSLGLEGWTREHG